MHCHTGLNKSCQANIVGTVIFYFSHHLHAEKIILGSELVISQTIASPVVGIIMSSNSLPAGITGLLETLGAGHDVAAYNPLKVHHAVGAPA